MNMLDGNTAALEKYEHDELMRSYLDDAAERNFEIAAWREDRKAELYEKPDELNEAIFMNIDGGDILLAIIDAMRSMPATDCAIQRALHRHDAVARILDTATEQVLDVEQELGDFR